MSWLTLVLSLAAAQLGCMADDTLVADDDPPAASDGDGKADGLNIVAINITRLRQQCATFYAYAGWTFSIEQSVQPGWSPCEVVTSRGYCLVRSSANGRYYMKMTVPSDMIATMDTAYKDCMNLPDSWRGTCPKPGINGDDDWFQVFDTTVVGQGIVHWAMLAKSFTGYPTVPDAGELANQFFLNSNACH